MSDGNDNTNLLPYNNYQSGLRAGRAQMKRAAIDAFTQWYISEHPSENPATVKAEVEVFYKMLP